MAKKRLLLIEDDYDVADMLLMYFRSHQYEVLHADDGRAGIDLARTKFPNLILLDVMLPYMDGYDVCIHLRRMALTKYIPILFLTQRDERAAKVHGLELGADDYITKPFDIDELRLRVQGVINRATREHLHEARTGLPTGPMIREEINHRINTDARFTQLIYTVDGLSHYHDIYGFMAVNDVLEHAGNTIKRVLSEQGTADDFVGIDEDRFMVLTHAPQVDDIDGEIQSRFNNEVRAFYSFFDLEQNGVVIDQGDGEPVKYPLMTLSSERRSSEELRSLA